MTMRHASPRSARPVVTGESPGVDGNERLTAWAGAALLVGFAAQGVTILNIRWWLTAHLLIGLFLLAPVAVKIASTGYRFFRYYTNDPAYRRKGPPHPVLRATAPLLLANTVFILLSGVAILVAGSYRHQVEELHTLSLWPWLALTGIHVLVYLWRIPGLLIADLLARGTLRSAAVQRIAVVGGACLGGAVLAILLMPWVRAWVAV